MKKYQQNYLNYIALKNPPLAVSIEKTINDVVPQYIKNFSYQEHVTSLLVGEVQSGKTSHMFGLMCAAADEGFPIFILLTTDNIILQQQTLARAKRDLIGFCICDELDYQKFIQCRLTKPTVIVLKKNGSVLKQWKNNLASSHYCIGNPLFIVDDEADAASLNTKVNSGTQSRINKCLEEIKKTASSSIYMEVTGTPQANLLQTIQSGWKPYFIYYFTPGEGYVGGNIIFDEKNHIIHLTDNGEGKDLLLDDEYPENGLLKAVITHLVTSAQIFLCGGKVCNFLVHPSQRTSDHQAFAEKVGCYLNELSQTIDEETTIEAIKDVYSDLQQTKSDLLPFDDIYNFIKSRVQDDDGIKILTLNSKVSLAENTQYEDGINIIIGGNSLGRGITFPCLQTVYYCRIAKNPQADTMWQHARMFGYDRDVKLMRIFMPPKLYKLFSEINTTNNSINAQIQRRNDFSDIKIFYPPELRPTRKNVLDNKAVSTYCGGVNYFPFEPSNKDISVIDDLLKNFDNEGSYTVSLKFIINILEQIENAEDDWQAQSFIGFINSIIAENSLAQAKLIVRRNRDIAPGTGTLLSENDRKLGDSFTDITVLTMYKVTGQKGWDGKQIWIPNIKLPSDKIYYSVK
ncbi:MAG: Z1 domain-containing protein [Clostridia bacterium]|nr:Z1 domain-containing protein [Clostridia bacterium]